MSSLNDEAREAVFRSMSVPRALAAMAVPTVISQLVVLVYSLADTFFIGMTDDHLMVAGASIILPLYGVTGSFASIAGVGGGTLISRMLGAGDRAEARSVSAFSFWLAASLSLIFSITAAIFMTSALDMLGASADVAPYARQYAFCVIVLGAVPTVLTMVCANLIRSAGMARQASFGVSMGGAVNIALDPLFMFVLFPKGMETAAAGAATLASNIISLSYFLSVIYRARGDGVLSVSPLRARPARSSVVSVLSVGIPASFGALLFDVDYMVIGRLMSKYGDAALAAIGITLKAERLPLNIGVGICLGMVPLAGYNFSSGNIDRMRKILSFSRSVGVVIGLVSVAVYEIAAAQIAGIFIGEGPTAELTESFLRVRAIASPLMFMSFHLMHFFQSVGRGGTAMLLACVRWGAFNIPMLFALEAAFGMPGILWSQTAADILTVIFSFVVYLRFESRMKTAKIC